MYTEIFEAIDKEIPESIKEKLKSDKIRKEMLKKYKDKAFLDPKNLRFPVVNPDTGKFDCRLIYAAYIRSSIHASKGGSNKQPKEYYENIKIKAKDLYMKQKCDDKIKIKLSKEDIEIGLMELEYIFEI